MALSIDDRASLDFVLSLRRHWAATVYPRLRADFDAIDPPPPPVNDAAGLAPLVHGLPTYPWFSWLERGSQKMLWRAVSDAVTREGPLPAAPDGAKDYVWDDVVAMETLNSAQFRRGEENHVCPLPFDVVERLIERFTNPGELVLDPFGGLGTTPYIAVKMGRRGACIELNPAYWQAAVQYLREAEIKASAPTLFDLLADGGRMAAD